MDWFPVAKRKCILLSNLPNQSKGLRNRIYRKHWKKTLKLSPPSEIWLLIIRLFKLKTLDNSLEIPWRSSYFSLDNLSWMLHKTIQMSCFLTLASEIIKESFTEDSNLILMFKEWVLCHQTAFLEKESSLIVKALLK